MDDLQSLVFTMWDISGIKLGGKLSAFGETKFEGEILNALKKDKYIARVQVRESVISVRKSKNIQMKISFFRKNCQNSMTMHMFVKYFDIFASMKCLPTKMHLIIIESLPH